MYTNTSRDGRKRDRNAVKMTPAIAVVTPLATSVISSSRAVERGNRYSPRTTKITMAKPTKKKARDWNVENGSKSADFTGPPSCQSYRTS